jgi:Arc/MetJ family transcription regulator
MMLIGINMRTTITVEDALYEEALRISSLSKPSDLFSKALHALIRQEKAKRLASIGGSLPEFKTPMRNR